MHLFDVYIILLILLIDLYTLIIDECACDSWWFVYIVVPGIIGCLQALEAIKIASAVGEPLSERMLLFDALSARIRIV